MNKSLPKYQDPVATLRIDVPLATLDRAENYDAIMDAIKICLSISRAAFGGQICSDPEVRIITACKACEDGGSHHADYCEFA